MGNGESVGGGGRKIWCSDVDGKRAGMASYARFLLGLFVLVLVRRLESRFSKRPVRMSGLILSDDGSGEQPKTISRFVMEKISN